MLGILKLGLSFVIWGSVAALLAYGLLSAVFTRQMKDLAAPVYCGGRVEQTGGGKRSRFICLNGKKETDVTILAAIVHLFPLALFGGTIVLALLARMMLLSATRQEAKNANHNRLNSRPYSE
ncbi:MAG TPA: hypothetical protein VNA17_12575 [Pyrinomonadaceae bacterium]|nr:hypothetical protein [Pyrinomonadaceae bacterium]